MISVKIAAKQAERFVTNNAPMILTAVGAVGSVGSVVLAVRATMSSAYIIGDEQERRTELTPADQEVADLTPLETVKLVWKEYIPTAGLLALSVTSIICSNRVSTKRAAAMAAAYSISEKAYAEYREKVLDKFKATKEQQVRDEIAQDRVLSNPPSQAQIIVTGNGDVLCYDKPSDRYFKSNLEKIRGVQNDMNAEVIELGFCPLSDFYAALNLPPTPYSDEIGWSTSKMLNIIFSAVLTDDNQSCICIDYSCEWVHEARNREDNLVDTPPWE